MGSGKVVMSVESSNADVDHEGVREKVRKAVFRLMHDDRKIPDPKNLSEKSGVSETLINQIYPTIEDLAVDITDVLDANLAPQYDAFPEPGDLQDMLTRLVEIRIDLYEETAFVRTYAEVSEHMFPKIREKRAIRDGLFRARIFDMLQPHFGQKTDDVAAQVEALVSWEFWRHMRNIQRLSEKQTRKIVGNLVRQVVRAP
ncbi:MAG: hypothetical protein CMI60_01080 [Parvibaculum sp.]|jgi:hypothetical protein|nr:hypothetical protein [Parvibaculum sp.]|tara:strand:- start:3897 stop:4496 length:600 start_codon:yes stop_codon:yes gene_type:complete